MNDLEPYFGIVGGENITKVASRHTNIDRVSHLDMAVPDHE